MPVCHRVLRLVPFVLALAVALPAPTGWELFAQSGAPTVEEARAFLDRTEKELKEIGIKAARAQWIQSNFITHDTEGLAAEANKEAIAAQMRAAKGAARFAKLKLPDDLMRKLDKLRTAITLPAPDDPAKQTELSEIAASMESQYGKGQYCRTDGTCLDVNEISRIMVKSRDAAELADLWRGWHTISPPMKPQYERFVTLANEGARELGYADLGALWRSGYDMPADAFAAELDRLWNQVKPLYDALHCHMRAKLAEKYGADLVKPGEPIPAHLLGNIWSQSWGNVYDLAGVAASDPGYDLTALLKAKGVDEVEMVRIGERFFTSLGFEPLPATFWERSLLRKPADREVVCHASAWNVDLEDDLRIKMCIEINDEDFATIHHELGHNYYYRAYRHLPLLFQDGANDGFHEGVGDTLALSITPEYLVKLELLDKAPGSEGDLGLLMRMALDKVAFLPFGLVVDQWRWKVFSGAIPTDAYNAGWWDLRAKYQGIAPTSARSEKDFDAGAKYHVPANTPYTRYFLAHILQFQFHRALAEAAGCGGPLHRCSIYGDEEAGKRLRAMLAMGASRPWPDALEALTGSRTMDATAIIDYFAPLKKWLDEQNKGRTCGW